MGMKFIDWDEFHYLLLALLFNCLAIKNLVTVFTLGTNLPFSSKTACLKGRSYEFKRVGRSVIIYGQGPLVSVATTTAAIQTLEESKGEFVC